MTPRASTPPLPGLDALTPLAAPIRPWRYLVVEREVSLDEEDAEPEQGSDPELVAELNRADQHSAGHQIDAEALDDQPDTEEIQ
jgi:hypothetical protein